MRPGSYSKILTLSDDFQNQRDPTHSDKNNEGYNIFCHALCGVQPTH